MGFRYFIFDNDVNFIVDSHVKIENHVKEAACKEGGTGMSLDDECVRSLRAALQHYLDLMYDCDVSRVDDAFAPTVQLHGFRDGAMQCWPAGVCRDILAKRQSPESLGAPREDALLLLDFACSTQALIKVRVRIATMPFIDYLTWHRIEGRWLITSKGFHLEAA
jgi:putative lumazine-binding protein